MAWVSLPLLQHASGTLAICSQFLMSKCLTGEVLGNAFFFPFHLLPWLSKNGKKTSREVREEVWGLNYALTDALNASTKTGYPPCLEITFNLLSEDLLSSNHKL